MTVKNSSVHDYQKNGITGDESGTNLIVQQNSVRGQGPTTGAGENGIQIGFGATGLIIGNNVIDSIWSPDTPSDPGDAADGILIYDSAGVRTLNNVVGNTQFGIAYVEDSSFPGLSADNGTIIANHVFGTLIFDGMDICSNNNSVIGNSISAVLEWIGGKLSIHHDRSYQVVTNDPPYDEQLANQKYWSPADSLNFLPGSSRSEDCFVRAGFYISAVTQSGDPRIAAAAVFSVIRNASAPYGVSLPGAPSLSTTRWRVVADQKSLRFYGESATSPNISG